MRFFFLQYTFFQDIFSAAYTVIRCKVFRLLNPNKIILNSPHRTKRVIVVFRRFCQIVFCNRLRIYISQLFVWPSFEGIQQNEGKKYIFVQLLTSVRVALIYTGVCIFILLQKKLRITFGKARRVVCNFNVVNDLKIQTCILQTLWEIDDGCKIIMDVNHSC